MTGLRLPRHRGTTAHIASLYPFQADPGLGSEGVYLGTNLLTGGGGFAWDPFTAYQNRLVTNPNIVVAGEPGVGKSATIKCLLYRACGVFGRWVAIADPKGEYEPLAHALDLTILRLRPGGTTRLNPLDPGPAGDADPDELARRQATMVAAMLGTVLRRDLTPIEDAVLSWSCASLARRPGPAPTLGDLANAIADPSDDLATHARLSTSDLRHATQDVLYGLGKLLDRTLRGMFDGPSTVTVDWASRGLILDLSAVHHDPDALAVVMVAATSWLQAVLARPDGPPRIQVLDEAWALLAGERTARYLQAAWKLGRSYGVANLAVVHRLSDLRAQADDGTATAKVAMGLLADTQTRILFRQAADQIPDATTLLGLTPTEATVLARLCRGRALWKLGPHAAVVQHVIAPGELHLCDTDTRMARA